MKHFILFLILIAHMGCQLNNSAKVEKNNSAPFYIGTYTNGNSHGIYKYNLANDGTMEQLGLVAKTNNPSFIALSGDKTYLLNCSEVSNKEEQGSIELYQIENDTLLFISKSSSGGAHPCFVAINAESYVLAANYNDGNIGLLKIDAQGKLSDILDVQQHTGKGTTDRQDAPHAHSAWFSPNSNEVIAVDLGTNELWFYLLDTTENKLISASQAKLAMAEGAGPRHLTFHPNNQWIYVLNELNGTVSFVQKNAEATYGIIQTISTLPLDFNEFNKSADIHSSSDGMFLYASNRGHNSIAIFSINQTNGELTSIGYEATRGIEPRSFALSPNNEFLVVANQNSNTLVSFKRDATTGLLTYTGEIKAPTPVKVLFE